MAFGKYLLFAFIVCSILISCASRTEIKEKEETTLTAVISINNTLEIDRSDEPITLKKEELEKVIGNLDSNANLIIKDTNGSIIPYQTDDTNFDGIWDELSFVANIPANSNETFIVSLSDTVIKFKARTHLRFAHNRNGENNYTVMKNEMRPLDHSRENNTGKYQMEGPAWENDVVAFRYYFDYRNGKDIYGKQTKEMILDSVGIVGDYHKLQYWGMDILKVNNSLGAGAIAMFENGKLYRLTGCDTATYNKVFEGPVRSRFMLNFKNWKVGDNSYNFSEEITIWAGKAWYESKLILSGFEGEKELVTGIVNISSDSVSFRKYNDKAISISTHAPQAYDGEYLGMGILATNNDFLSHETAPEEGEDVTQTYYIKLKTNPDNQPTFRFYVGWEVQDKSYADFDYFMGKIAEEGQKLGTPVSVSINAL